MGHINKVCLIGNLCKSPTLRITPSGKDICDLLIAVNRKSPNTDYLPVIVWGKDAVSCSEKLTTGSLVAVIGKIQSRNYEKADKSRHVAIEIVAEEIEFLDKLIKGYSTKEIKKVLSEKGIEVESIDTIIDELKTIKKAKDEKEVVVEE